MKKLIIIVNIIALLLFIQCQSNKIEHQNIETVNFVRDDFPHHTWLKSTIIDFTKELNPDRFSIIRDSLLLVYTDANDYYFDVYNLKNKDFLFSFGQKGKGPGEFLQAKELIYYNSDYLQIRDLSRKKLRKYHIDSLLRHKGFAPYEEYQFPSEMKEMIEFNQEKIIGYNRYFLDGKTNYNTNNYELLFSNKDDTIRNLFSEYPKHYTSNVTGGYILVSPNKKHIVVANSCDDHINFYNRKLELKKILKGPDNYKIKYRNSSGMVMFEAGKDWTAYFPSFFTKKFIYLTYVGCNGMPRSHNIRDTPVEVFKISWKGDLIHRYSLDRYIRNLYVDHQQKYLYGTSYDSLENALLVRFKL